jgi:hypothetical protein
MLHLAFSLFFLFSVEKKIIKCFLHIKYEHALKMDARTTRNRMSYKPILNSRQNFHQITKYEHALKGHADVASRHSISSSSGIHF